MVQSSVMVTGCVMMSRRLQRRHSETALHAKVPRASWLWVFPTVRPVTFNLGAVTIAQWAIWHASSNLPPPPHPAPRSQSPAGAGCRPPGQLVCLSGAINQNRGGGARRRRVPVGDVSICFFDGFYMNPYDEGGRQVWRWMPNGGDLRKWRVTQRKKRNDADRGKN